MNSNCDNPILTIRKEWFEHCKKSWYNEGYIDGQHNRDRQLQEPVSEELEEEINIWMGHNAFPEGTNITPLPKAMKIVEETAHHFANWQKEKTINKAYEWLNKNVGFFSEKDFRKAMED